MAIEVLVIRGEGDKPLGPAIVDPLYTSVGVAVAGGGAFINRESTNRKELQLVGRLLPYAPYGSMVRVRTSRGSIVGCLRGWTRELTLTKENFAADTQLTVEVEDEQVG